VPAGPPDRSEILRDWVYRQIRSWIAGGILAPGEHIAEKEIVRALAVSRVPVREAMRALQAQGYLMATKDRGVAVREVTTAEIDEMFEVRGALEALAGQLAARRRSAASIAELRDTLTRCKDAISTGDMAAIRASNRAFHVAVRATSGNRFIGDRLDPLVGRLEWFFTASPEPDVMLKHHGRILAAIENGDEAETARLMLQDNAYNHGMALWQASKHTEGYSGSQLLSP
jgi:DNA-binding GntR family transcriptional regulator